MASQSEISTIKAKLNKLTKKGYVSTSLYFGLLDLLDSGLDDLFVSEGTNAIAAAEAQMAAEKAAKQAASSSSGMTQAEYEAQKKQKYQDYKAGKITNYAYIQWKKQNDPTKQPQTAKSGAVSAPAAKAGQTAAPKQTASSGPAKAGMTQAEYEAQKKEMYKKYKNGEITNYAYIQWKKQNDPSKNGSAAGQNGPVTAPKSGGGTSTGAGTKAASKAITSAELKQLKQELTDKYTSGEITWEELNDYGAELSEAYKQGKSLGEAKQLMPGAVKAATPAQAAPKLTIADENQYDKIAEMVNDLATGGDIDYDDANELHDLLGKLIKAGIKPDEAQLAVGDIVYSMEANGQTVTDTDAYKDIIKKAAAQTAATASGAAVTAAAAPADPGQVAVDTATEELEKRLKKTYKQAEKELTEKFDEWSKQYAKKDAEMQAKVAAGEITQAEYQEWQKRQVFMGEIWKQKLDQASGVLLGANQQAMEIINGQKMGVFAENANWQSYQLTQDTGMNLSFAVYDADAVARLVKDRPELMPRKVVNGKKDKAWNQTKMANIVAQGIIQGEGIPKIAKRIATETTSSNMKAMLRYARTAMTNAQNAGRMETLHRAKGMGIQCKKVWLATLDSRTRDSHRNLDGQVKDIDEPFVSDLGKIMFPGDPAAAQGDVWNCRCTLTYQYEGYPADPAANQRYDQETGQLVEDMTYNEWSAAKQGSKLNDLNLAKATLAETQKEIIKKKIKEDKVYSDLWKDDVTLADYPAKKASIQAKRDYYEQEIAKLQGAIANGQSWATPEKLKELQKKLKQLNEFEENGQLLEKRDKALKAVQDIYDQVGYQQTAAVPLVPGALKKPKKTSAGNAKGTKTAVTKGLKALSDDIVKALGDYTGGEDLVLSKAQMHQIKDAMEINKNTMYRVEQGVRTGSLKDLKIGDSFEFAQQVYEAKEQDLGALRSFTRDKDLIPDLLYDTDMVIYKTVGDTYQLGVDPLSQYNQAESLVFGNKWKIVGKSTMVIDGVKYPVVEIQQDLSAYQQPVKKGQFAPDAWDDKTKKAAKFYDHRSETDKVLRPELDKIWPTLTDEEKFATWLYTWNSHPMNQPLSGYNDGWNRSNYVGGPDKTEWGHQDNYSNRNLRAYRVMRQFCDSRGQPSYKKAITDLTNAIEKSEIKDGIWFKRQSDENGLAGIMEATGFDFKKIRSLLDGQHSQKDLEAAFVGQKGKMNSFTSCGMAKDADWFGNVYWKVYVPKGTKGLYSEPQSHYGNSMGGRDELYVPGSAYRGIGTEAEVILQRGTEFRITGIKQKKKGNDVEYEVEMEVVAQPDYFVHGDEDTYNNGKTRHKK